MNVGFMMIIKRSGDHCLRVVFNVTTRKRMWIVVNLAAVASLGVPSLLHWQVVVHHRAESSSSFIFEFLIDISVHARGACCRLCCCCLLHMRACADLQPAGRALHLNLSLLAWRWARV